MSSLVLYQVIVICILESQFQVSIADNNFLTGKKYFKILSFIFIMFDVTFWNGKIRQYEYMYEYPFQKFLLLSYNTKVQKILVLLYQFLVGRLILDPIVVRLLFFAGVLYYWLGFQSTYPFQKIPVIPSTTLRIILLSTPRS